MNVHEPAPTIPSDALTGSVDTAQGVLTVDITFKSYLIRTDIIRNEDRTDRSRDF